MPRSKQPSEITRDDVLELTDEYKDLSEEDEDDKQRRAVIRRLVKRAPHEAKCELCWQAKQDGRPTELNINVPEPFGAGKQNRAFRINTQYFPPGPHTVKACTAHTLLWMISQNDIVDRQRMGADGRGIGKRYEFDLEKGILGERARIIQQD